MMEKQSETIEAPIKAYGRVKDRATDRRLAENRSGPSGQGKVNDPKTDRRLKANRKSTPRAAVWRCCWKSRENGYRLDRL